MSIFLEDLRLQTNHYLISNFAIKIAGEDAQNYLHSQTTNDVKNLGDNQFQFNSILEISGKIISSFILCKKNSELFYLILNDEFIADTIERIEKYHIAEEFEVSKVENPISLVTNSNEDLGFKGSYFFENDQISLTKSESLQSKENFNLLKILCGIPELGIESNPGELVNNTRFDELGVDYKKGCYPGQETVAKIETRRGAAFKPVLIKIEGEKDIALGKITVNDKKVGEVKNVVSNDGITYLYTDINRENRIDNFELIFQDEAGVNHTGTIHYYPFLSPLKKQLAIDLYDYAVELFHNEQNEKAIEYFKKAIEIDPKFEDAYESLGVLYGRLDNYDEAIKIMEQLKSINEKSMMAYTNLSLFFMKKGDIETAEKYKADATILNFQLLGDEAQVKKQNEEIEQKRLAEIARRESMFKQVLEMDPDDAMANNGMGEILLDRKNYLDSINYFKKAIESNKKYSVAYLGLAKSYYQLEKLTELKEILNTGIKVASTNGDLMPANEMQAMLAKLS